MDHFAGLDVSVKETSICIVDDTGKIAREVKVASEPEALLAVLKNPAYHFKRIGLEAGPLSQWLFNALAEAELPVVCVETRHMQAVLKAQINKTDRNDARGIVQMMRAGLYRPVHVKTLRSQKLRMLLTHRKLLQAKAIAVENDLRATLRNFGLKVGMVGTVKFEARVKELVENLPDLVHWSNHCSLSAGSCSLMKRMRSPGESTALARMTCLRRGTAYFVESKNFSSGQKRMVVPVLRLPTVPTTFSSCFFLPSANHIEYSLPSRRTQTCSFFERALTTETPTPCRPPE